MPWTQKQMLRDANGDLIPQYWDVVEQEFKPLTGSDGANDVRLTGSNMEDAESIPSHTTEKYELETVLDAHAVEAGGSVSVYDIPLKKAPIVFVAISIDKAPWELEGYQNNWTRTGRTPDSYYPKAYPNESTHSITVPFVAVPIIRGFPVENFDDALKFKSNTDIRITVNNKSDETATVTAKILRIWR